MRKTTHRAIAASAALALVFAGCGDGSADESAETTVTTEATVDDTEPNSVETTEAAGDIDGTAEEERGSATTAVTETTEVQGTDVPESSATTEAATPAQVVADELAAQEAGDWEAVAAFWADDAVAVQPDGTEIGAWSEVSFQIDDFDGDGVVTIMDDHLATAALTPAIGKTIAVECTDVSDTVVECTESTSNAFSEAASVDPLVIEMRITVEDGLIVRQEFLGIVGDADAFETATMTGFADYGQWVLETAPDDYDLMFDGTDMMMTLEAIELHNQMLPTYIDQMS